MLDPIALAVGLAALGDKTAIDMCNVVGIPKSAIPVLDKKGKDELAAIMLRYVEAQKKMAESAETFLKLAEKDPAVMDGIFNKMFGK